MSRMQRTGEVVVSARGERDADDGDGRIDRLESVVRAREEGRVLAARDRDACLRELRLPEARLVRLVSDDEVADTRVAARDELKEIDELAGCLGVVGQHPGIARIDGEDQPELARGCLSDVGVEQRLVRDRPRLIGIPDDREPVLGEPDVPHRVQERRRSGGLVTAAVIRRTDDERRRRGGREDERSERGKSYDGELGHA